MDFNIDLPPPEEEEIAGEREQLTGRLNRVRRLDMIVTTIIVMVTSTLLAFAVYWFTNNIKYAAISAVVYPVISVVLSLFGITTNTGFRSAAREIIELNNNLISLKPVPGSNPDIDELSSKYEEIRNYVDRVREMGRDFVNGELAVFWAWDAGTQAEAVKARSFVDQARESIKGGKEEKKQAEREKRDDDIEGFVLDDE